VFCQTAAPAETVDEPATRLKNLPFEVEQPHVDDAKNPYRENLSAGSGSEIVTVILSKFLVNDMKYAKNIRISFKRDPPFVLTSERIENLKLFIAELEGEN
jgi:hypothetical protein